MILKSQKMNMIPINELTLKNDHLKTENVNTKQNVSTVQYYREWEDTQKTTDTPYLLKTIKQVNIYNCDRENYINKNSIIALNEIDTSCNSALIK